MTCATRNMHCLFFIPILQPENLMGQNKIQKKQQFQLTKNIKELNIPILTICLLNNFGAKHMVNGISYHSFCTNIFIKGSQSLPFLNIVSYN